MHMTQDEAVAAISHSPLTSHFLCSLLAASGRPLMCCKRAEMPTPLKLACMFKFIPVGFSPTAMCEGVKAVSAFRFQRLLGSKVVCVAKNACSTGGICDDKDSQK